ncbi:hypothetical protein BH09MYX1_BH09MYX1_23930 [soil metagenome]
MRLRQLYRSFAYVPLVAVFAAAIGSLAYCAPDTTSGGDPDAAVCDPDSGTNCACDSNTYKTNDCYSGPKGSNGKGICKAGKRSCVNGVLTACVGEVLPRDEVCNLADDDCNGVADDVPDFINAQPIAYCTSPACSPTYTDAGIECFSAVKNGICGAGKKACAATPAGGAPTGCDPFPNIQPVPEECNGLDDDCNGEVDDGLSYGPCFIGAQKGACANGEIQCVNTQHKCTQIVTPQAETCNGIDDDCDGEVDKAGLCGSGQQCCHDFGVGSGVCTTFTGGWDECK